MNEIKVVLIGCSNSGKSTFARNFVEKNPTFFSFNKDKMREMLFSYNESNVYQYYENNIKYKEDIVSYMLNKIISCHALLDNTHLKEKYLTEIVNKYPDAKIQFVSFDTSLQDCLIRNKLRKRKVDEEIIKKQYESFQNLLRTSKYKAEFIDSRTIINNDYRL